MRRTPLLATAVVALTIAGCGGEASNQALSYSDFGEETNAICSEQIPALEALAGGLTGQASQDASTLADAAAKTKSFIEDIQDLTPPAELEDAVRQRNALLNEQYADLVKQQELAEAGDQQAYKAYLTAPENQRKESALSEAGAEASSKLGAGDCI